MKQAEYLHVLQMRQDFYSALTKKDVLGDVEGAPGLVDLLYGYQYTRQEADIREHYADIHTYVERQGSNITDGDASIILALNARLCQIEKNRIALEKFINPELYRVH
jgi:hypothetical protein